MSNARVTFPPMMPAMVRWAIGLPGVDGLAELSKAIYAEAYMWSVAPRPARDAAVWEAAHAAMLGSAYGVSWTPHAAETTTVYARP